MIVGVGNEIEVTAGNAVAGGSCLARHEGKVVLVQGALPGEKVRARIVKETKSLIEAQAIEILEPHARRRTPPCRYASECGGCDFQHAERDLQLDMKRSIVIDAFRRIAHVDIGEILEGPQAVVPEFGARTRIRLSYDSMGRPGLLRRGSHDVVPIEDCLLIGSAFRETVLPWMRTLPPWTKGSARFDRSGNAVVLLESNDGPRGKEHRRLARLTKDMERPPSVLGVAADGIPLAGTRDLAYEICGKKLSLDAASFFQGSIAGAEELVRVAGDMIGPHRTGQLLDLYAGVGLFAVCLGEGFEHVVASDSDERAVRHLRENLHRHEIQGEARAEEAQVTLRKAERFAEETVILDPPRIGMEKVVREALVARAPARIVSVSCDPATGARDVAHLIGAGWRLERIAVLDLFPATAHVETVSLLERQALPE
jgi:tRNA/tmRNA/rRNA uracil-C5-methylase (TrmA/RlmC/RlmD family)